MITAFSGLLALFFKWLSNNFKKLESGVSELKVYSEKRIEVTEKFLNDHEDRDQERHEENLHRFEKISVALARLGSTNGTYDREKNNT